MSDSLTSKRLIGLTDTELINLLRLSQCEMFVGRSGRLSVHIPVGLPEALVPTALIREAFRRRMRLLPYARVNGIRLRETGRLTEAA